jgi:hypothetical protein
MGLLLTGDGEDESSLDGVADVCLHKRQFHPDGRGLVARLAVRGEAAKLREVLGGYAFVVEWGEG